MEDYHQCLKTGCRLEERQVQSAERLIRLLGLLSPLAVRLLQLRNLAHRDPERPAHEVLDADLLAIVAAQADQAPALIRHRSLLESRGTNGRLFGPPGRWSSRLENLVERLASCPNAA